MLVPTLMRVSACHIRSTMMINNSTTGYRRFREAGPPESPEQFSARLRKAREDLERAEARRVQEEAERRENLQKQREKGMYGIYASTHMLIVWNRTPRGGGAAAYESVRQEG